MQISKQTSQRTVQAYNLSGLPLKFAEKVRYLGDAIGAGRGLIDIIILGMRSEWSKFRDSVLF